MRNITEMLRKGNEIKWTTETRKSFEDIKIALAQAPCFDKSRFQQRFSDLLFCI